MTLTKDNIGQKVDYIRGRTSSSPIIGHGTIRNLTSKGAFIDTFKGDQTIEANFSDIYPASHFGMTPKGFL